MTSLPRLLTFSLLASTLAACALRADDKADKAAEVKKLQGTWKIVSGEFAGKAMTPKQLGIDAIVVAGDKMTLKSGEKEVANYPFEIQPDRKPKGMVWTKKEGGKEGKLPVIYEVDGTRLKLCFPLLGSKPPKEAPKAPEKFETQGKPLGLLIAEKEKK